MKALLLINIKGKGNKGQGTVEFALAAILFFTFLFLIFDVGMMFYVNLTMQHAVREGTRRAVTGHLYGAADRRTALINQIRQQSMGLYDKNIHTPKDPVIKVVKPGDITFANYTGGITQSGEPGGKGDFIDVRLTYSWPLMTPFLKPFFSNGAYTFTVKTTMRNEIRWE